jgi:hypothetical protein
MAARAKKASTLTVSTGLVSGDKLIAVANVASVTNNALVSVDSLFANTNVPHVTVGNNALSTANLVVRTGTTIPLTSASNGVQGQVVWDTGFVYICIATNSWKRAAITTF